MYFTQKLHNLSFHLAPGTCVLCQRRSHRQLDLCRQCEQELPAPESGCHYCADPIPSAGSICAACLKLPPPFSAVLSAFLYAHPVDYLIQLFKDSGNRAAGYVLTKLAIGRLMDELQLARCQEPLVTPVPLHRSRLRQRGFNQAELISEWLANQLGLEHDSTFVRRSRRTENQRYLDLNRRKQNLRNAFLAVETETIKNRTILLVDDVVTTSSTAREISRVLLKAGAADVIVFSLARTPSQR